MAKWLTILIVIFPVAHAQDVWYVDKDNTAGTENGLAWGTAFTTVQPAIDAAMETGGGEVWVAKGVYDEARVSPDDDGVNTGSVVLGANVSLIGGFSGGESVRAERDPDQNITILDGSTARGGSPAYHVLVISGENIELEGFTITGGWANGDALNDSGAGVLAADTSFVISDCLITNNSAKLGSGIYAFQANARVIGTKFDSNSSSVAFSSGGGCMFVNGSTFEFVRCVFVNNSAPIGGAIRANGGISTIDKCLFENNSSSNGGSAIMASAGRVAIMNSIFTGNRCEAPGGIAVYMQSFFGFERGHFGELTVINSTFYDNNTGPNQSALAFQAVDEFTVQNTIIRESVGIGINKILDDDGFDSRRATALHNNVSGGIPWNDGDGNGTRTSQGNIDTDPLFVDPDNADFRLMEDSPSMDTGLLEGAHEFPANFDPNKDGAIDAVDVQMIINAALGLTTDNLDLNNDTVVNAIDVQLIINAALGLMGKRLPAA